ncbi:MAG: hypothetical protein ACREE4_09005 [Stellaceae bacterium]
MPKEPLYIRNFKMIARANPAFGDLPKLEAEIYGANDRARAVMLSAILETSLESFLKSKARPALNADDTRLLFDWGGPLGEFASKILIGYVFNLYGPDTRHDLDLVRLMRNEFAHSRRSFDFTTPEVAAVCTHLRSPDSPGAFIPHSWLQIVPHEELGDAADMRHPRTRYISTCHIISTRLLSHTSALAQPFDLP